MKNNFITKIIGATLAFAMMIGGAVGINAAKQAKEVNADEGPTTYQHVFDAKPNTGNNIALSSVNWNISATNLGSYNGANYAGVQVGTSGKKGDFQIETSSSWGAQSGTYYGKTKVTEIRLWLNAGTTTTLSTLSATVGGVSCTPDVTQVTKNSSAKADWTKATKITFSVGATNTGKINIHVAHSSNLAFYICCLEIDCEEPASDVPTVNVSSESLLLRTGGVGQTVTASSSNFSGDVSYSWAYQSGTDCVDLTNASSATVTMTPKAAIMQLSTGVYRVTATSGNQSDTADVSVTVDNGGSARPYTIAEARAAIDSNIGKENAYVKGIIYKIDSYNQQYHSITYWISDDGTNTNPLEVYSGLDIGGAQFTAVSNLSLGDIVVVTGELKKQNSTYEFNYNNQLVSRTSIASIAVKTAPVDVEYGEGENFDPTGLVITASYDDGETTKDFAYSILGDAFTFDPEPSVTLTNQDEVSITLFGKTTTQAITVIARVVTGITVTGDMTNKTYIKGSDWNYTGLSLTVAYNIGDALVVNLTNLTAGTDFTVSNEKADGTTSLTIAGTYNGDAITSRTITGINYTTSVTFEAGTDVGSSATLLSKYGVNITVSSGDLTRNDNYRSYASSTMTIACNAARIVKISFTCTSDDYNKLSGKGYVKDKTNGVWTGYSNNVSLSSSAQSRITQIVVTVSEVTQEEINSLTTSTKLSYHYEGNAQDGFEFSNISIRFGGLVSKELWNKLDTDENVISGFGVMIVSGDLIGEGEYLKDNTESAKLYTDEPAPSIANADIVNYYMSKTEMATPVEQGDNYVWNLFQSIDYADRTDEFVAAAYIKIGEDYVFFNQVRYSVESIAADYIANRGCSNSTAGGSLAVLANL